MILPSYGAFALGFVLWGARGALGSGALEALVYEELDRIGAAGRYARVMGRAHAAGLAGVMAAMAAAGPVFARGGYPAVGTASVLACLLTAATATRFPEHRRPLADDERWAAVLKSGLSAARRDRRLRAAVLLVPAVGAIWGSLDEYTPFLARETGVPDAFVPYALLLIWAGATVGGLFAGPAERLGTRGLAALLAGAALALAAGALTGRPAGLLLVAVAFGGFQLATVLADARMQHRIEDTGRATLTSVAGLGTEVATVAVYGAYAAIGSMAGHGTVFAVLSVPYLVTALSLTVRARTRE
ncbi:hypothetical protein GCM10020256_65300 [Streptomyces thermocoprophilus]